jgi:hypothetical protein
VALMRVALLMAVGRLEDASDYLDALTQDLDRISMNEAQAKTFNAPALRQSLRQLTYQKLLLTGDYKAAGAMQESIGGALARTGMKSLLAEIDKAKFSYESALHSPVVQVVPMPGGGLLPTTTFLFATLQRQGEAVSVQGEVLNKMQQDGEFYFQLGVLALFEGDMAAAEERFRQSRREPPPGWRLEPFQPRLAAEYLQLIEMARKGS